MEIVVCLKQVPDTEAEIRPTSDNTEINSEGIKFVINVYDEYAVEEALQVKERVGEGTVTLVTLGPERAVESIRTALATFRVAETTTGAMLFGKSSLSMIRPSEAPRAEAACTKSCSFK